MRDSETISEAVLAMLREECRDRGGAARVCRATGIPSSSVSNVLARRRKVTVDMLDRLSSYFGLRLTGSR